MLVVWICVFLPIDRMNTLKIGITIYLNNNILCKTLAIKLAYPSPTTTDPHSQWLPR